MSEFWLDTRTGDLIVGQAALEQRLPESGPGDVMPLPDILTSQDFDLPTEYYERAYNGGTDKDACLAVGHWTLKLLRHTHEEDDLKMKHLKRLSRIGIAVGEQAISRNFITIWQFREELGLHHKKAIGKFDEWTEDDYKNHASRVDEGVRGKPSDVDYDDYARQHGGPGSFYLRTKLGSIGRLNEMIGYPDFGHFTNEQLVDWGVFALIANKNEPVSKILVNALYARDMSLSYKPLVMKFGTVHNLRELIQKRYGEMFPLNDELTTDYAVLVDKYGEPTWREEFSYHEKCIFMAKYRIAETLLSDTVSHEIKAALSETDTEEFISMLKLYKLGTSEESVRSLAEEAKVEKYLWTNWMPNWASSLALSDEELNTQREIHAAILRKRYRKKLAG